MELVAIKNGFLVIEQGVVVYCKDLAEVHKEVEFALGALVPPVPPTEKPTSTGVRQFNDED